MTDTTLTQAQSATSDLAAVAGAGPRERGFLIKIDNEYQLVAWRGNQFARPWQVERGVFGSTPAAHSQGATVSVDPAIGGGGSISVTDGTTTVTPASLLHLASSTVTDLGGGSAQATPFGPLTWEASDQTVIGGDASEVGPYAGRVRITDSVNRFAALVGGAPADSVSDASGATVEANGATNAGTGGGVDLVGGGAGTGQGLNGGDINVRPGPGDGAGRHGLIIIGSGGLPTSDPHVVGALWNSSGTVHVSAG